MSGDPRDTQEQTRSILLSLFPAWLPPAFKVRGRALSTSMPMPCSHDAERLQTLYTPRTVCLVPICWTGIPSKLAEATCCVNGVMGLQVMFSRPLPELSCRLNAWVTMLTCQWLMGPCKVTLSCHIHLSLTSIPCCVAVGARSCMRGALRQSQCCLLQWQCRLTQQLTMHRQAKGWS